MGKPLVQLNAVSRSAGTTVGRAGRRSPEEAQI